MTQGDSYQGKRQHPRAVPATEFRSAIVARRNVLAILLLAPTASPACGGKTGDSTGGAMVCPSVSTCGGDPTGMWHGAIGAVCLDAPPPVPAGPPCEGLVYLPSVGPADSGTPSSQGSITAFDPPLGPGTPSNVTVIFTPDHSYNLAIQGTETDALHFAPACLTAHGAHPTCDDLAHQIAIFYTDVPGYGYGVACTTATDGGCDCSDPYMRTTADEGTWTVSGGVLTLSSAISPGGPTEVTFCRSAAQLQMTTSSGSSLLGFGPGTLTLTPMMP